MKNLILKNVSYQLLARISSALFSLSTSSLLIWRLGVSSYGIYSLVLVYIAIFVFLSDFGINAESLKKFINREYAKSHFYSFLVYRLLVSAVSFVILFLLIGLLIFQDNQIEIYKLVLMCSPIVLINSFSRTIQFISQSEINYKKYSLSILATNIVGIFLVFIVSYLGEYRIYPYILVYLFIQIFSTVLVLILFREFFMNSPRTFSIIQIKSYATESWILGIALIVNMLMFNIDRILLGKISNTADLGIYSFSYRIFDFLLVLPTFIMNAYFPLVLLETNDSPVLAHERFTKLTRKMMNLGFLFTFIVIVALIFVRALPTFFYLDHVKFREFINVLLILVIGLPLFFLTSPLSWKIIYQKKYMYLLVINVVALVVNLLLNYIFIPIYSYYAASIVTIISELIILVGLYAVNKHKYVKQ